MARVANIEVSLGLYQEFAVPALLMCPERQSLVCCPALVLPLTPGFQELGLQLCLGNTALQIEYCILANAQKQLSILPSA